MEVLFKADNKEEKKVAFDDGVFSNTSEFYRNVAKTLVNFTPGCEVSVNSPVGNAKYTVNTRSGTILVSEVTNYFKLPAAVKYPHVYLTCVESGYNDLTGRDKNHYKFYELEQKGSDVVATYGRIGTGKGERFGERSCSYPLSMFWIKYEEKIAKGYKDKSNVYLTDEAKPDTSAEDTPKKRNTIAVRLIEQLKSFCRSHIENTCRSTIVTVGMIKESKRLLARLYDSKSVSEFNTTLLELLAVSPRKVDQVRRLLADDERDFSYIIDREENLINAMEGVQNKPATDVQPLDGIKIKKTSAEDQQIIDSLLDARLKANVKVTGTWKVESKKFDSRFKQYCKKYNITNTRLLWHGSRNENWLSIIQNGLLLNPNAIITGKMFGNGIYFAPSCLKSWNYTSFHNTIWAKGNSNVAFMGIYETAFGDPKRIKFAHSYTQADLLREGKNCIFAEGGGHLRHDEIVFYSESAMVLKYLVRFEG